MIISVHLPKTAGISFEYALRKHFNKKFLRDSIDFPINKSIHERIEHAVASAIQINRKDYSGIECIHGHFMPVKYMLMACEYNPVFVTWIRNPVERVISHYYYWIDSYDERESPPFHRRVVEENWSLEKFCLSDQVRNIYSEFLWGFHPDNFDFIGVTEFYSADLVYFSEKFIGSQLEEVMHNIGKKKSITKIDEVLHKKISAFHQKDIELYSYVLERRKKR